MEQTQKELSNYHRALLILTGITLSPIMYLLYSIMYLFPIAQIILCYQFLSKKSKHGKTGTILVIVVSIIRVLAMGSSLFFIIVTFLTWIPLLIGFIYLCIERKEYKKPWVLEQVSSQSVHVNTVLENEVLDAIESNVSPTSFYAAEVVGVVDTTQGENILSEEEDVPLFDIEPPQQIPQKEYIATKYDKPLCKIQRTEKSSFQIVAK